ncbi:interferon-induced protein 44-like [Ruditapes philippinarum]|uniref:interferon-induced protein 44-like n=1 Tax=Ruditapes philippinarum TaxID=129788 RepID=UPI00295B60B1|nr:interferon-induced protein 44-like [Ruditapes philippinarum]
MGDSNSKPGPPPPSPFTSSPWRTTPPWTEDSELSLRKEIKQIKPEVTWKPTFLLVGPVGAGKSSFVNAVLSVSKGHKVDIAVTESGNKSCTTTVSKLFI